MASASGGIWTRHGIGRPEHFTALHSNLAACKISAVPGTRLQERPGGPRRMIMSRLSAPYSGRSLFHIWRRSVGKTMQTVEQRLDNTSVGKTTLGGTRTEWHGCRRDRDCATWERDARGNSVEAPPVKDQKGEKEKGGRIRSRVHLQL